MTAGTTTSFLLEPAAYVDGDWYRREQAQALCPHLGAGRRRRHAAPAGDYLTATVGGVPLVVVVGEAGERRVFQTTCAGTGA